MTCVAEDGASFGTGGIEHARSEGRAGTGVWVLVGCQTAALILQVIAVSMAWGGANSCGNTSAISPPGTNSISLNGAAFQQGWIYELTYTAINPYVAGVGMAAMRDFVSFLKNAKADTAGTANPVAGDVKSVASWTLSQPGRLMNDFVWLGFNQDTSGKKVFDGVFNWINGGDGLGINYRFAQVGRTERNRQHHIGQLEDLGAQGLLA